MGADETRGPHSPIFTSTSGKSDPMMVLAVMVILVVFIFVIFAIFAFRGERNHNGGIAEVATAGLLAKQAGHGNDGYNHAAHVAHDNCRDNLREFGELKKEIALVGANSDAKAAQYFYQTQKATDDAKFEAYKITVEQGEKSREQAERIERERRSDELARERENNLYHRIVSSLRPVHPPMFGHARAFAVDEGLGVAV